MRLGVAGSAVRSGLGCHGTTTALRNAKWATGQSPIAHPFATHRIVSAAVLGSPTHTNAGIGRAYREIKRPRPMVGLG